MKINHPLKTYRAKNSLTRAALARLLKVSKTTVARWEEGIRKIDENKIPIVSSITGIPAKELRPDLVNRLEQLVGATP
jgi:transcriptional regulator with XRE-family HTH domain